MRYLEGLNQSQRQAVTYTGGPLLVIAGAGSGKTKVLTSRIAFLIDQQSVNPYRILALTFTNKAAEEMKKRVKAILGLSTQGMWVSTFHSACLRLLRQNPELVGYKNNFTIYDTDDSLRALKSIIQKLGYDQKRLNPKFVASRISWAKAHLLTPDELSIKENVYKTELREIFIRYQMLLKEANAMDFDDLILNVIHVIQNDATSKYFNDKFDHILVDEYQDTNRAQNRLLLGLSKEHQNVTVVGDLDQSIYGFRGAYPANVLEFEERFANCKVIKLEQNYRSTTSILDVANKLIKNSLSPYYKELYSNLGEGEKVIVANCENEVDEAIFVVEKIREILKQDVNNKIAIFYRANWQSRVIEEQLYSAGISYRVLGGFAFYERREVKDILAYLAVSINPYDELNFLRIANVPRRGLGPVALDQILAVKQQMAISIPEALARVQLTNKNAKKGASDLLNLLTELSELAKESSPDKLINHVLKETGYEQELLSEGTIESESRLENLQELKSLASLFETTEEFLGHTLLMTAQDELDNANVSLMTLHTSKGLEFDTVFITGCEENLIPHIKSLDDIEKLEEERRLLYVGITRAKTKLYLCYANQRSIFGRPELSYPSRFLFEITSNTDQEKSASLKEENFSFFNLNNFNSVISKSSGRFDDYKVGDKVEHLRWGQGVIKKIIPDGDDTQAIIEFENRGEKTFLLRLTPLKKI